MREAQRVKVEPTHQWGVYRRLAFRFVGDPRECHILERRNAGPVRKERFEEELWWHRTNDFLLDVASKTLMLITGDIGQTVDVVSVRWRGKGCRGSQRSHGIRSTA